MIPLISLLFPILYFAIPRIDPRKYNVEKSRKAFAITIVSTMAFMAVLHAIVVAGALGRTVNVSLVLTILVGILFMVIGNYMGKIKSNFFIGFRTPWTLSSDISWNKTNRLAGWLLVLYGLSLTIASICGNRIVLIAVFFFGIATVVAVPMVYSYTIWKKDPGKTFGSNQDSEKKT